MSTELLQRTVGELVAERPARARVFEQHGIDFCCGGKTTLAAAAHEQNVDPQLLVTALQAADAPGPADERDWTTESLQALVEHIVQTHHVYLRAELPRIGAMVDKVKQVHGTRHEELTECQTVFHGLREELASHMVKEERVLFPLIVNMEASGSMPGPGGTSIAPPVRQMEHEHDTAGAALAHLRELTGDYTAPEDACNTYRAMLDSLLELETDLHLHIHKENNILFPRAAMLEESLTATRPGV